MNLKPKHTYNQTKKTVLWTDICDGNSLLWRNFFSSFHSTLFVFVVWTVATYFHRLVIIVSDIPRFSFIYSFWKYSYYLKNWNVALENEICSQNIHTFKNVVWFSSSITIQDVLSIHLTDDVDWKKSNLFPWLLYLLGSFHVQKSFPLQSSVDWKLHASRAYEKGKTSILGQRVLKAENVKGICIFSWWCSRRVSICKLQSNALMWT